MRKLPLANSLYQQQHALARHEAGDQPKEGVSRHLHIILYMKFAAFSCQVLTAPKPKQPTTHFAEGGKQLPWEVREEEEREEGAKVARSVVGEEKLVEATVQKQRQNLEEDENEAARELKQSEQQEEGEKDLLKDLDIVAVSEAQCSDAAANCDTPDALDGPPHMLDTPAESPDIVGLPEAPWSEPGSPKVKTTVP